MYSGSVVAAAMPWIALRISARSGLRRAAAATRATAGSMSPRYWSRSSSSLRCRMTRRISSSAASESLSRWVTNVPPLRPRRASTSPPASSMRSAFWMVGRPTPNITASSRSAGSDSPGLIRRSEMWRRICSATYSCARSCWIRSKRTPVVISEPLVLTATGTLRAQPGDAAQEPVEEALAPPPDLGGKAVRLLQQRVGVDPIAVELVAVGLDPALHDLRRHLWMKLQAQASPDHVGLRRDVGLCDELRARREREGIELPVKPQPLGNEIGVLGPHGEPADLRMLGAK